MNLPDDLQKASNLLTEAGMIIASRLAGDGAPRHPEAARNLSTAIAAAHASRLNIESSLMFHDDDPPAGAAHLDAIEVGYRR